MRDYLAQITTPTRPAITTPTYTVPRTSALALDMLKLSLVKHSAGLLEAGISNPLARPSAGTGLFETLYDSIHDYAVRLLRERVPFYYETVTGEPRAVQSATQANAAIDYMPRTMKLWGYARSRETPVTLWTPLIEPTPVYSPPVTEQVMVDESKVILWAVSRSLGEMGIPSYPLLSGRKERLALSERKFASLLNRAIYIADQMVQQNTYSPRL